MMIIFEEALRAAGFDVMLVKDGQTALDWLAEHTPLLASLDLHLPNVSGADILRYIRETKRLADTKVVLTTADPRMAEQLRYKADLVLLKPISFSRLRDLSSRFQPNLV